MKDKKKYLSKQTFNATKRLLKYYRNSDKTKPMPSCILCEASFNAMLEKRQEDQFASADTCPYCPWKIFEHITCIQYSHIVLHMDCDEMTRARRTKDEWFIEQRIPMLKRWIREYNIHFKKEKQNAENGNVTPSATA